MNESISGSHGALCTSVYCCEDDASQQASVADYQTHVSSHGSGGGVGGSNASNSLTSAIADLLGISSSLPTNVKLALINLAEVVVSQPQSPPLPSPQLPLIEKSPNLSGRSSAQEGNSTSDSSNISPLPPLQTPVPSPPPFTLPEDGSLSPLSSQTSLDGRSSTEQQQPQLPEQLLLQPQQSQQHWNLSVVIPSVVGGSLALIGVIMVILAALRRKRWRLMALSPVSTAGDLGSLQGPNPPFAWAEEGACDDSGFLGMGSVGDMKGPACNDGVGVGAPLPSSSLHAANKSGSGGGPKSSAPQGDSSVSLASAATTDALRALDLEASSSLPLTLRSGVGDVGGVGGMGGPAWILPKLMRATSGPPRLPVLSSLLSSSLALTSSFPEGASSRPFSLAEAAMSTLPQLQNSRGSLSQHASLAPSNENSGGVIGNPREAERSGEVHDVPVAGSSLCTLSPPGKSRGRPGGQWKLPRAVTGSSVRLPAPVHLPDDAVSNSQGVETLHTWDVQFLQIDPLKDVVMGPPLGSGGFGTVRNFVGGVGRGVHPLPSRCN